VTLILKSQWEQQLIAFGQADFSIHLHMAVVSVYLKTTGSFFEQHEFYMEHLYDFNCVIVTEYTLQ
jgi:hypothetical protein